MSDNPFGEVPANPYASPAMPTDSGSSGNPLLIPAIVLLVFSLLTVLLIVATLPGQIIRLRAIDTSTPAGAGELTGGIVALVVWPLMNVAVALGAISMLQLKSYRSASTAAIASLIPVCSPCLVLGIPFGIWALVVLSRRDVKRRFTKT